MQLAALQAQYASKLETIEYKEKISLTETEARYNKELSLLNLELQK